MSRRPLFAALAGTLFATGCATQPLGPTARVMPMPGKPFEVFAQDQALCRQFADSETDGGAIMSNVRQFGAAAVTTALGAGLGAALRGGRGAEVGAALGGIGGAAMAARGSARDQSSLQGRYDLAYAQCMFARGNQVLGVPRAVAAAPPLGYAPAYAPAMR